MNRRIIIADILSNTINGKQTGHYFALARNYLELFGKQCFVAGGPVYKKSFQEKELIVLPNNNVEGDGMLKLRLRTFKNARHLFKETMGDIIVLQQCTTITTFLCILFFYHKKSKLFFIQYSLEGLRNRIGRILFRLSKHKIDGIICPNEDVGNGYGLPYCIVPDYIYTGISATSVIPYEKKIYDFCMVGRISEEKGIIEAAKVLSNKPYKVLIAGRPQTDNLETDLRHACTNSQNIELHLEFVTDEAYKYYLSNSKYAILNYKGEYSKRSSGVVYDTLFSGVPVIGCNCKALSFIEKNKMGVLFENIRDFDFGDVLEESKYEMYQKRISEYRKTHKEYKEKLYNFLTKE